MFTYPDLQELTALLRDLRAFLLDPSSAGKPVAKGHHDFVTAADLGVQQRLRSLLCARYPHIRFMGEEDKDHTIDPTVPTFVLDPIDGTSNYIFSFGISAVSLALVYQGQALSGAVYNPYTDELFAAERGKGAFCNGKPIHVLDTDKPGEVLAAFGTSPYRHEFADVTFSIARQLFSDCIDIRRSGSAAADLVYVADGRTGLFVECNLQLWDYAAGTVILEEAGGRITDWEGAPLSMTGPSTVAASNGKLHDYLLKTIAAQK
ncbi:MAG: inositol monophosphatase [Ruminococcaceae bacterium]|nr:inositol monophosphatase [Oscillospiraceae bacterium]